MTFPLLARSVSEPVVSLAQQFDVLDIRRDFGWQRRLRVGLGEAVAAKHDALWHFQYPLRGKADLGPSGRRDEIQEHYEQDRRTKHFTWPPRVQSGVAIAFEKSKFSSISVTKRKDST